MAFGLYELDTERLIRRILRPGDHFVDAGANIGYFTMLGARLVGPGGRVDAFEPQPDNRARLKDHLERNGLSQRVRVCESALGDRSGTVKIHFYMEGANHGSSTLFAQPGAHTRAVQVPMQRMDEVLGDEGVEVKLVKMDIEGAEPLAVAGMAGLLRCKNPPQIICEYNPAQASVAGFAPREFIDRILAIQPRYGVYRVGVGVKRIEPTDTVLGSLRQGNLLFRVGSSLKEDSAG